MDMNAEKLDEYKAQLIEIAPRAYRVAFNLLGGEEETREAIQDAFLNALKGLRSFRGEAKLETWFIRIVINAAKKRRRKRSRYDAVMQLRDISQFEGSIEHPIKDTRVLEILAKEVEKLSTKQHTAFTLRFGMEYSMIEIAEIMGCSTGSVKTHIHRAVRRLRDSCCTQYNEEFANEIPM